MIKMKQLNINWNLKKDNIQDEIISLTAKKSALREDVSNLQKEILIKKNKLKLQKSKTNKKKLKQKKKK